MRPGKPLRRKTPLRAATPLKPSKALERGSELQRTAMRRSRPKSAVPAATTDLLARRSGGRCELALPGCWGTATDAAHRKLRGMGGRRRQAAVLQGLPSAAVHACRWCHGLTTSAVGEALAGYRAAGILLLERQDPAHEPVELGRGIGRVWLSNDGAYLSEPPQEVA